MLNLNYNGNTKQKAWQTEKEKTLQNWKRWEDKETTKKPDIRWEE